MRWKLLAAWMALVATTGRGMGQDALREALAKANLAIDTVRLDPKRWRGGASPARISVTPSPHRSKASSTAGPRPVASATPRCALVAGS